MAIAASHRVTRWIARRYGDSFPFYYVSEYPKSGGTWLARMVGDYLEAPVAHFSRLPMALRCVIPNHWGYEPRLSRVLYLYRDGRDVMVSLYFHHMKMARRVENPVSRRAARTYERLFGKGFDPEDAVGLLPRFIEHEFANPGRGTRLNWRDHVEGWARADPGAVTHLSYEDLRRDCAGTLGRALEALTGEPIDAWGLETAVEKMSMKRQTGRDPGQEDGRQHIRKGIIGDWRNYFSREAAEIFDHLAGETLVRLGYEPDRGWVGSVGSADRS